MLVSISKSYLINFGKLWQYVMHKWILQNQWKGCACFNKHTLIFYLKHLIICMESIGNFMLFISGTLFFCIILWYTIIKKGGKKSGKEVKKNASNIGPIRSASD